MKAWIGLTNDWGNPDWTEYYGGYAKQQIILDPTKRAAWINWGVEMINYCNPDGIEIMNEPGQSGYTTTQAQYRVFVDASIAAYRGAKPSIIVAAEAMPFYTLQNWASDQIDDPNFIYELHHYLSTSPTGGPQYTAMQDAYLEGRLDEAKVNHYAYLNWRLSTLPKERVFISECGILGMNPPYSIDPTLGGQVIYWENFMVDLYDFMKTNHWYGLLQWAISWNYRLLKTNGIELQEPYGQLWADNIPSNGGTTGSKPFDYGLWFSLSDFNTPEKTQSALQFIGDGKIDLIVLTTPRMNDDNTLSYSEGTINNIISTVKTAYPQIEVWASVFSWDSDTHSGAHDKATEPGLNIPDFSTSTLRQKSINEIVAFWNQFSGKFDGMIDDCEVYYGTGSNQMHYFSEAAAVLESMGVPYYPWLRYTHTIYTKAKKASVGLYDAHAYPETQFKEAMDLVQNNADNPPEGLYGKDGYQFWLIVEQPSHVDDPKIPEQLEFFDEQIALRGWDFYDKLEMLGIWWYRAMEQSDKDAWISWVNRGVKEPPITCSGISIGQDGCPSGQICCCLIK